jgi:hypothetical protein
VPAPKVLSFAGSLGILAGVFLIVDSLAVDLFGNEDWLPNTIGVLTPPLGVLLITGVYAALRPEHPTRLLDVGYLLNVAGLVLVSGVDVARTYVLSSLSDDRVDALLEAGPTRPAFTVAGLVFVIGAITFGAAVIRSGFAPRAAWLYVLTALPSGIAPLLPDAVGAAAQALAGVSIVLLAQALRTASRTATSRSIAFAPTA